MSKMTIYTRPRDSELWIWTRHHAETTGLSVSHHIVEALRAYRKTIETLQEQESNER